MAKLIKTFENSIERTELQFLGKSFTITMMPTDYGSKSIEKAFDIQVGKHIDKYYVDVDTESEDFIKIDDVLRLIDGEDNDDVLDDLKILDKFEKSVGYHAD